MAEFLSIDVTLLADLQADLAHAVVRLEHPRDLMQALGAVLEANIERRFDRKRDPNGGAWAKLAASTLKKYAAQDKGKRQGTLLERTGQMRNSLTANAGDDFVELGMNRLTDGGAWSLPLLHETGTTRMPRRGIFLADPEAGTLGRGDEADLESELVMFLDDVFGA